ncbi:MAG: hypothetical protein NTZ78_10180 [Candidatus Aureabacteria bacterium]|nr:hypothetical protein [Candidatus Auribacterota bacterium]
MKIVSIVLLLLLVALFVKFAYAEAKQGDIGKQLGDISAKLDTLVTNQAKLDKILENQETMMQMLRIIRQR